MGKTICFYGRGIDKPYVQSFLEGFRCMGYDVIYNKPVDYSFSFVAFNGNEPKFDKVRKKAKSLGIPSLFVDLGFLRKDLSGKQYYQTCIGKLGGVLSSGGDTTRTKPFGGFRYDSFLKPDFSKGKVVILGQVPDDTQHRRSAPKLLKVYSFIVEKCIKNGISRDRIILRTHPKAPIFDLREAPNVRRSNGGEVPLKEDLKGACLAITLNSTAYFECIQNGVPVMASRAAFYYPYTVKSFLKPMRVKAMDLGSFISDVCYSQWTELEMRSKEHVKAIERTINNNKL